MKYMTWTHGNNRSLSKLISFNQFGMYFPPFPHLLDITLTNKCASFAYTRHRTNMLTTNPLTEWRLSLSPCQPSCDL